MKTLLVTALIVVLAAGAACKKKSPGAPSATVTSVVVSGNASYINKNQTSQLTAVANMSDGTPDDVTGTATWLSSAPTVASVSATGLVTALNNGAAAITASSGGQTGTLNIAVTLKAQPQLTVNFQRLCSPFRAHMDATITEASNNAGMNITALTLTMKDFYGVVQYSHTFTSGEITTLLGTNHVNAGQSRVIAAETAYSGNVDTTDSTGTASMTTVDDFGNTVTTTIDVPFQHDGC
jgi:hypothetical protein